MKKTVDAVIFDLDGTLTDTEKYYQIAWPKALSEFGYASTPEMILSLRSLGRPFAPVKFKEWFGESFDYNCVRERRKAIVEDLIRENGIPLKPGATEILEWLRANRVLTAVATANEYPRTERYLKQLGLFDSFDKIICANMVPFGKPAPDIYSYACHELGISPDRAFAVEDSPNGVISASDAGCLTIMVPDLTAPDEELSRRLYKCLDSLIDIKTLFD